MNVDWFIRARTLGAAVAAAMDETVAVKERGRSQRITKLEATAKQLATRAGDQRAMQLVARLIETDDPRPEGVGLCERGGQARRRRNRPPSLPAPAMTAGR